jgi:hypothetical protein
VLAERSDEAVRSVAKAAVRLSCGISRDGSTRAGRFADETSQVIVGSGIEDHLRIGITRISASRNASHQAESVVQSSSIC